MTGFTPKLWLEYLAVFVGGAGGAIVREVWLPHAPEVGLITATFTVNILACFAIGWLFAVRHKLHSHVMHLGAVGFCGGLSSFSTLVSEVYHLAESGSVVFAVGAPLVEVTFGVLAALTGEVFGRKWHGVDPDRKDY